MAKVKQFKVRKGYTWLGPDRKPTGAQIITSEDPGFKAQRHKVEPLLPGDEEKPGKKRVVRKGAAESNRQMESGSYKER